MHRRAVLSVTAFAAAFLVAGGALAYVRSRTTLGTPVFWPGSCAWILPDTAGTPDLPLTTVSAALGRSIAAWQNVTRKPVGAAAACSYFTITQDDPAPLEALLDHKNVLKFRTDKWCRPAESGRAEMCFSPDATAITTVFYDSNPGHADDGTIIDADIEMNNVNFTFAVVDPTKPLPAARAGTTIADLENTHTHELGHFQGLGHTCWNPDSDKNDPTDNTNAAIPLCSAIEANPTSHQFTAAQYIKITGATMFNYATPGEVTKRTPEADDIKGICEVYPAIMDPKSCARPDAPSKGCAVAGVGRVGGRAGGSSGGVLGASCVLLALLFGRRRRESVQV